MSCSRFDELLDDDDFWLKVAQFNENLFIWNSLKIYSNSEGNASIIGSLNDSIIVHNNNYENVFDKRTDEGSFTKFLRSRSIGLLGVSEKMGLIKKKSLCQPQTNQRIRIEYIKSLLNAKYEIIERYTFLKNACKLKNEGSDLHSAEVEIIVENSDKRFPIARKEISLKRTLGLVEDNYFINNRHVKRSDFINFLESAGFSQTNPYYIVQQGKVNSLAMMKDSERLDLLKEVSGTRMYEEKRKDSLRIMSKNETSVGQINQFLEDIELRLKELDEEKEELKQYQLLDRQRRSLEYTIYDHQLTSLRMKLDKIEEQRKTESEKASHIYQEASSLKESIKEIGSEVKDLDRKIESFETANTMLMIEKESLIKSRVRLELDVKDLKEKKSTNNKRCNEIENEIQQLTERIESTKKKLKKEIDPKFQELVRKENELKLKITSSEVTRDNLYSKINRKSEFENLDQKRKWLNEKIESFDKEKKGEQEILDNVMIQFEKMYKEQNEKETELETRKLNVNKRKKMIENLNLEINNKKSTRDNLMNERKELWREESEIESQIQNMKERLLKIETQLQSSIGKGIAVGLEAVKKICQQNHIPGVYGPIIELLDCQEEFMTAVEVTAGMALFFVVVDSDETASKILNKMNQQKVSGRVTFVPLNKIRIQTQQLQKLNEQTYEDAVPMIKILNFQSLFKKAFQHIFGKTLICKNLEVATMYSKTKNVNCVTLEGDQASKKGALTGGYINQKKSRLRCMKSIRQVREKISDTNKKAKKTNESLETVDQEISQVIGEIEKQENNLTSLTNTLEQLEEEINNLKVEIIESKESIKINQKKITETTMNVKTKEESIQTVAKELEQLGEQQEEEQLSQNQTTHLTEISNTLDLLQNELVSTSTIRMQTESEKIEYENLLDGNLLKCKEELIKRLETFEDPLLKLERKGKTEELNRITDRIVVLNLRIQESENEIKKSKSKILELNKTLESDKSTKQKQNKNVQKENTNLEKIMNKRKLLLGKRSECLRNIRELGSLPTKAFEQYQEKTQKELLDLLKKTTRKLKKYSHVNKKAINQYISFTEQRENLLKRKKEMDSDLNSIEKLIQVLDQKKNEAIQRTFKQTAKKFQEIFKDLVPDGEAKLVMLKGRRVEGENNEIDEELNSEEVEQNLSQITKINTENGQIEQYVGCSIKVRFDQDENSEIKNISELSGGQKTIVALALIFAIQKCDPSPLYLFDEIDSALDSKYRNAVSTLIKKESLNAQFILTTFKPELVNSGDKYFVISYRNKISQIRTVNRKQALRAIKEDYLEENVLQTPRQNLLIQGREKTRQEEEEEEDDDDDDDEIGKEDDGDEDDIGNELREFEQDEEKELKMEIELEPESDEDDPTPSSDKETSSDEED
ncbi:structural maintenance of chromosomes protein [Anaeramoeba flamelloides]|uniref:Structural maintenance of chromosomes protein n=1 Tax=Anaeramoeba flamelloides TaxID=1746091 RepID=A0AAV7ZBP3_9EUKA|nr:structural maintenance of chromosomes protein [Anaeramoeba flamelloides]